MVFVHKFLCSLLDVLFFDAIIGHNSLVVLVFPSTIEFFQLLSGGLLFAFKLLVSDIRASRRKASVQVRLDDTVIAVASRDSVYLVLIIRSNVVIDHFALPSVPEIIG